MSKLLGRLALTLSRALHNLLQQFAGWSCLLELPSTSNRMSWVFGAKSRPSSTDAVKEKEHPEKATEKLQAYHELAKDTLERAYKQDVSGHTAEASKLYRLGIDTIYEGLGLQVPSAWLTGSNVNKWRSNLNSWLQLANDRLRDLESPEPSTSATQITKTLPQSRLSSNSKLATQGASKPTNTTSTIRKDKQSIARQRSAPDRKKETAEDAKLREAVLSEVLDIKPSESWNDIAGLGGAKQALQEMVILPTQRADLFQGLRAPARGLLLYGPPGNGKTMLAKALAHEAKATFFNISAATLTSKWHGEGEKLVRMLFKVAQENQPAIIFIDEIDSILSERSSGEHDASRRLKTEFLVQFDGVNSGSERIVVLGATNRPQELDDAIRRRLVKRIYIPLPDDAARRSLITAMLQGQPSRLKAGDIERVVCTTDGYSGSDIRALCREAAMVPIRELGPAITTVSADRIRPLELRDFVDAARKSKPSVNRQQLGIFQQWTQEFGTTA
ncbi:MAG: spastin-like [Trebouxia sp. A1-2]|nr:MAG: spastin-like [Trebouxia sp. A1-2]